MPGMFERRLRIFLVVVFLGGLILAARAAQVQVAQRDEWTDVALATAERVAYLTPQRGDILDAKGRVLATDEPAFEACVNYRAIEPDEAWLAGESKRRARKLDAWKTAVDDAGRARLVAGERDAIVADLDRMWDQLARVSGQTREQIDDVRRDVVAEVQAKHASYWKSLYRRAADEFATAPPTPWYERWIAGERTAPAPEAFQDRPVGEQLAFHPILGDVGQNVFNELKFAQDALPQFKGENNVYRSVLELRATVRRRYPFGDVACHVIGRVGPVSREDRASDPNKNDALRSYALIDRIGREGIEGLAEQQLRGDRGARTTDRRGEHLRTDESTPGRRVRTTIDVALQREIQDAFKSVDFINADENPKDALGHPIPDHLPMNGAAVVIDVATGEVRAIVSVPTFDLNQYDQLYATLVGDDLNRPLTNRALWSAVEPGSTAKPIVGLGAITQGLATASDTIECLGHPIIDGKPIAKPRCWVSSMYPGRGFIHHSIPSGAPHPTGFLNLADAIERSCNVYFVTQGDKLGVDGLSYWMRQFGLGRETGIGLPEARGTIPATAGIRPGDRQSAAWYASIGQGPVNATPIQVANEMATIARGGVWMRPRLVPNGSAVALPATRPSDGSEIEDRVDLHLDPAALSAVHRGMFNVVNSEAGTGKSVRDDALGVKVAAKTGSATASPLVAPLRDEHGVQLRDERGKPAYRRIKYGNRAAPNPELPWYRRSGVNDAGADKGTHSWVGGYMPADRPQVAFAVFVEYGNSGGIAAGSVVKKLIAACVKEGYVTANSIPATPTPTPGPAPRPPSLLQRPAEEPIQTEEPGGAPEAE